MEFFVQHTVPLLIVFRFKNDFPIFPISVWDDIKRANPSIIIISVLKLLLLSLIFNYYMYLNFL